jgi:hypothetical protein
MVSRKEEKNFEKGEAFICSRRVCIFFVFFTLVLHPNHIFEFNGKICILLLHTTFMRLFIVDIRLLWVI